MIYYRERKFNIDRGTILNQEDYLSLPGDNFSDDRGSNTPRSRTTEGSKDSTIGSSFFATPDNRKPTFGATDMGKTLNFKEEKQSEIFERTQEDDETIESVINIILSDVIGDDNFESFRRRKAKEVNQIYQMIQNAFVFAPESTFQIPSINMLPQKQDKIKFLMENADRILGVLEGTLRADRTTVRIGSGVRPKMKKLTKVMHGKGFNTSLVDYNQGIQSVKKFVPFGRYLINRHRLNDDVISISRPSGNRIKDFPSRRVSQNLCKVFKQIVGKGHASFEDLEILNDEERSYLYNIAKASNLLEKIDIPAPPQDKTDELVNKYEILKGQILAGNDNREMVKEFKESLLRLSELKLMPKSQTREILMDLTSMGY